MSPKRTPISSSLASGKKRILESLPDLAPPSQDRPWRPKTPVHRNSQNAEGETSKTRSILKSSKTTSSPPFNRRVSFMPSNSQETPVNATSPNAPLRRLQRTPKVSPQLFKVPSHDSSQDMDITEISSHSPLNPHKPRESVTMEFTSQAKQPNNSSDAKTDDYSRDSPRRSPRLRARLNTVPQTAPVTRKRRSLFNAEFPESDDLEVSQRSTESSPKESLEAEIGVDDLVQRPAPDERGEPTTPEGVNRSSLPELSPAMTMEFTNAIKSSTILFNGDGNHHAHEEMKPDLNISPEIHDQNNASADEITMDFTTIPQFSTEKHDSLSRNSDGELSSVRPTPVRSTTHSPSPPRTPKLRSFGRTFSQFVGDRHDETVEMTNALGAISNARRNNADSTTKVANPFSPSMSFRSPEKAQNLTRQASLNNILEQAVQLSPRKARYQRNPSLSPQVPSLPEYFTPSSRIPLGPVAAASSNTAFSNDSARKASRGKQSQILKSSSNESPRKSLKDPSSTSPEFVIEDNSVSLSEFLRMISIDFMDNFLNGSNETRRDVSFHTLTHIPEGSPVLTDFAIAYQKLPILEQYDLATKHMKTLIESSKGKFAEIEEIFLKEPPPILKEYLKAPPEVQEALCSQFRAMKLRARFQAKQTWYKWRLQQMEILERATQLGRTLLKSDQQLVEAKLKRVRDHRLIQLASDRENLLSQIERARASLISARNLQSDEIHGIRKLLSEAKSECKAVKMKVDDYESIIENLKIAIENVKNEKTSTSNQIAQMREQLNAAKEGVQPVQRLRSVKREFNQVQQRSGFTDVRLLGDRLTGLMLGDLRVVILVTTGNFGLKYEGEDLNLELMVKLISGILEKSNRSLAQKCQLLKKLWEEAHKICIEAISLRLRELVKVERDDKSIHFYGTNSNLVINQELMIARCMN